MGRPHHEADARLRATLRSDYRLDVAEMRRVSMGQATLNYHVRCDDGSVIFVKRYQRDADLPAEETAIGQAELAGQHRIPVAPVRRNRDGHVITQNHGTVLSVWDWVEGDIVTCGLSRAQQRAAGQALGRIHQLFAIQKESRQPAPALAAWLAVELPALRTRIDELLELITQRSRSDEFNAVAKRTLLERRATLDQVPGLIAGLPAMSTQVLHGDYSAVNLLFRGQVLAAVLDFRPPEPFLTAYELGRIAFDPRTVCHADDWPSRAFTLIEAYLRTRPDTAPHDVVACARVALLQLLLSLYGVENHYRKPGLLQADLDTFWALRHQTAMKLLDRLDDIETALNRLAHGARRRV